MTRYSRPGARNEPSECLCALRCVSSPKQAKDCTIDSQIQTLKEKIASDGEQLIDEMVFSDAGVSGATLIRPELERLRDAIAIGATDHPILSALTYACPSGFSFPVCLSGSQVGVSGWTPGSVKLWRSLRRSRRISLPIK